MYFGKEWTREDRLVPIDDVKDMEEEPSQIGELEAKERVKPILDLRNDLDDNFRAILDIYVKNGRMPLSPDEVRTLQEKTGLGIMILRGIYGLFKLRIMPFLLREKEF
jgi:hypothetical protein